MAKFETPPHLRGYCTGVRTLKYVLVKNKAKPAQWRVAGVNMAIFYLYGKYIPARGKFAMDYANSREKVWACEPKFDTLNECEQWLAMMEATQ